MRLYMAGPLFTPYERAFTSENAAKLRALGFECFVPHEEAGEALSGSAAVHDVMQRSGLRQMADYVFAKDNEGLLRAHAVVALLDGPTVDDGTACEIGLFYGLMQHDPSKVGIVGILTDARAVSGVDGRGVNLYLLGCIQRSGGVFDSVESSVGTLEAWREQSEVHGSQQPQVAKGNP